MAKLRTWMWHFKTISFFSVIFSVTAWAGDTPLDKSVRPNDRDEIPNVFRDMGVVQRRAMPKVGRFLISSYGGFDFSDGPYTNYALNVNPGYAVSDFFEIYFNYVPMFFVSPRSIVQTVAELQLANGKAAEIEAAKPVSQMGVELLWAPAYGKDSLGIRTIIRSDTFMKFGYSKVTYDTGESGSKFQVGVGKTYFVSSFLGLRAAVNFGYLETIVQGLKAFRGMALIDGGIVVYF